MSPKNIAGIAKAALYKVPGKSSLICKSLPFFYFLTFEMADCSIFALLVGRLVGLSVDVTLTTWSTWTTLTSQATLITWTSLTN